MSQFDEEDGLILDPDSVGHRARKRFGQNFLQDFRVIDRIVQAVAPLDDDQLVEIGPGLGALTGPLLRAAGKLTVVELDRDLAAGLPQRLGYPQMLTLVEADALKTDFCSLVRGEGQLRVVGNLPYNISTPILFHLISQSRCIHDMHFMLQKEVVDRIVATPGTKDYGRLSVMVQYHCQPTFLFEVPPGAFNPPPKVTSAVFRLQPYGVKPIQAKDEQRFAQIVHHVFTQRRKTLRNSLKNWIAPQTFEALSIDPMTRPEMLSVGQFVALSDY